MTQTPKTLGRTELAQQYFPYILPHSAWQKFRAPRFPEPPLVSPRRSKHYLPTPRASVKCPILVPFRRA